jgi:transcriptional regulator with XRE-family HTH domain
VCDESFNIDFNDRSSFLRNGDLITPPVISAYLAGPLTCNDETLAKECLEVREAIKSALENYDFLGVRIVAYDPAEVTAPNSNHSPEEVYETDHLRTICSDLIIFLINGPSLGVGIESQLSAFATTPRIVVKKKSVPLSRMFSGMFGSTVTLVEYENAADVYAKLSFAMLDLFPQLIESAERRRPHIEELQEKQLGKQLLEKRLKARMPLSELARLTDIQEWWLDRLERIPSLAITLSLLQIKRIAEALDCHLTLRNSDVEITDHDDSLKPFDRNSISNLAAFMLESPQVSEKRAFKLWESFCDESTTIRDEAMAFRGAKDSIGLSVADWRKRYNDQSLFN